MAKVMADFFDYCLKIQIQIQKSNTKTIHLSDSTKV